MQELDEWYAAGCPWEGERGTVFMEFYLLAKRQRAEKAKSAPQADPDLQHS